MKKRNWLIFGGTIITFFIVTEISSFLLAKNSGTASVSKTITYNIENYNKTGSLTVDLEGSTNSRTGQFRATIRVTDENGKLIQEITPELLNKSIQTLEKVSERVRMHKVAEPVLSRGQAGMAGRYETMLVSMMAFKEILETEDKFKSLVEKFTGSSGRLSASSSLPFTHIISTIRNQQETISGAIQD